MAKEYLQRILKLLVLTIFIILIIKIYYCYIFPNNEDIFSLIQNNFVLNVSSVVAVNLIYYLFTFKFNESLIYKISFNLSDFSPEFFEKSLGVLNITAGVLYLILPDIMNFHFIYFCFNVYYILLGLFIRTIILLWESIIYTFYHPTYSYTHEIEIRTHYLHFFYKKTWLYVLFLIHFCVSVILTSVDSALKDDVNFYLRNWYLIFLLSLFLIWFIFRFFETYFSLIQNLKKHSILFSEFNPIFIIFLIVTFELIYIFVLHGYISILFLSFVTLVFCFLLNSIEIIFFASKGNYRFCPNKRKNNIKGYR